MGCCFGTPSKSHHVNIIDNAISSNKKCDVFSPTFTICRCIDVYDGDTCTIIGVVGENPYKFSVRMLGYDTPEMKSDIPGEKYVATIAKNLLSEMILDKYIRIEISPSRDKYGRLLATLYDMSDGSNINEKMKNSGLSCLYNGKTKRAFMYANYKAAADRQNKWNIPRP